jgi:hypothetical protein
MALTVRDPDALFRRDRNDARLVARLGGFTWLGVAMRAGVEHRVVPAEFWSQEVSDDGVATVARVACPCGHEPVVELAAHPVKCECSRWFFYNGTDVWSLCGPRAADETASA